MPVAHRSVCRFVAAAVPAPSPAPASLPERPVAFALLALLLVFLSSVTYQQTTAPRVGQGFTGPLDHLVVAGQHESLRVLASNPDAATDSGEGPDIPAGSARPSGLRLSSVAGGAPTAAVTPQFPQPGRYLRPHLRAPPLA